MKRGEWSNKYANSQARMSDCNLLRGGAILVHSTNNVGQSS